MLPQALLGLAAVSDISRRRAKARNGDCRESQPFPGVSLPPPCHLNYSPPWLR